MLVLLLLFFCAWGLALLLTHHVRGWSVGWGLVDIPDHGRHDHDRPIARAGGIAVFGAVTIVLGLVLIVDRLHVFVPGEMVVRLMVVGAGAGAIFALGLWDDARHLGAPAKFTVQILIALAVFMAGVRIEALPLPQFADAAPPFYLSLFLTVGWLVGVTNAFNLIDGSDGVAGGAAVLACLALGAVSLVNGNEPGALVAFVLAGAVLGFLFFNFPPASIFLGDSGSLFIGFMLAAMAVVTTQTASTALAVAVPIVCLGLPILDTLLVMVRRFLRRKPLFRGDRLHIHHILRDLGHSPRRVALVIYAVCVVFALLSLLLVRPAGGQLAVPFVVAGIVLWVAIRRLRLPELMEVGRVMERGLAQREVIAHNLRVREAVSRLRTAQNPAAMIAALESAFDGSEFRRGEFWLPVEAAGPLIDGRSVRHWEGGCLWRWAAPEPFREEDSIEVRLVFRDAAGGRIGRFSLWRPLEGRGLFTDFGLIATELLPELQRGLERLAEVQQPSHAAVERQARVVPSQGRLSVLPAGGR
jgi:UDP-GlcNAc:undecaprenyl-phosphate/decaprenyl-phosphate GlcNAc-1-phosphate transferase